MLYYIMFDYNILIYCDQHTVTNIRTYVYIYIYIHMYLSIPIYIYIYI